MALTPDQQEYYEHLQITHPNFIGKGNHAYPHLAHLTSPAERYKHLCETYRRNGKRQYNGYTPKSSAATFDAG